jgi:predicted membrane GTPase involved in stress response
MPKLFYIIASTIEAAQTKKEDSFVKVCKVLANKYLPTTGRIIKGLLKKRKKVIIILGRNYGYSII